MEKLSLRRAFSWKFWTAAVLVLTLLLAGNGLPDLAALLGRGAGLALVFLGAAAPFGPGFLAARMLVGAVAFAGFAAAYLYISRHDGEA